MEDPDPDPEWSRIFENGRIRIRIRNRKKKMRIHNPALNTVQCTLYSITVLLYCTQDTILNTLGVSSNARNAMSDFPPNVSRLGTRPEGEL